MGKRSFGQITRLPSKRYRARYTGPDTALHNAPNTFDTRLDAEAWLTDERRRISAGSWSPPASRLRAAELAELERRRSVFSTYARGWLAGRHDLRATTCQGTVGLPSRRTADLPAGGQFISLSAVG